MDPEEGCGAMDEYASDEDMRSVATGLYCFINPDRVCGAECMAYLTHPRTLNSPELNSQQAHCSLVLCFERLGRNITVLASIAASGAKRRDIEEADRRRTQQFKAVPEVSTRSPFPERKT